MTEIEKNCIAFQRVTRYCLYVIYVCAEHISRTYTCSKICEYNLNNNVRL